MLTEGATLSEEIRQAVEMYLAGATQEGIELLDEFSLLAEKEFSAMIATLDASNKHIDEILLEREKLSRMKP